MSSGYKAPWRSIQADLQVLYRHGRLMMYKNQGTIRQNKQEDGIFVVISGLVRVTYHAVDDIPQEYFLGTGASRLCGPCQQQQALGWAEMCTALESGNFACFFHCHVLGGGCCQFPLTPVNAACDWVTMFLALQHVRVAHAQHSPAYLAMQRWLRDSRQQGHACISAVAGAKFRG